MANTSVKARRVARSTTAGTRRRSASPAVRAARKTQFRSNQPTPVRHVQQGAGASRVVRRRRSASGGLGGRERRGEQQQQEEEEEEEEGDDEEEEEEEMAAAAEVLRRDAEQQQGLRLSPPPVPKGSEDGEAGKREGSQRDQAEQEESESPPNPSRYEPPPNLLPHDDSSLSLVSEFFSTPEPDLSNTQIEIEELDADLMLEMFPHLDAHSRKILDLLILKPPTRELRRLLLVPGSSASKRLRTYEQNFAASKTAYGTSEYISVRQVESALGGDETFRPILYASNLSILADVAYTSQGSGESTFDKLKKIEKDFPVQFGDVVQSANFQAALDLRTQYLVLALVNNQDIDGFDPDMWLKLIFFEGDKVIRSWSDMRDVENWEAKVLERVTKIRTTFGQSRYDDPVDLAMLVDMFPWDEFVKRISSYIKTRFSEIEKLRAGRSVEQLVENARDPQMLGDARERVLLDDREIPETVQGGTPQKGPEIVAAAVPGPSIADFGSANFESYRLKHKIDQLGRGKLESASIVVNAAQMRDLKRRKTMPAPETVPVVRGTPRVATSLGLKDLEGINMAQVKFLKAKKQQTPSKPAETPGPSKQPEAAEEAVASKQVGAPEQAVAAKQVEAPAQVGIDAPRQVEAPEPMEDYPQPLQDEGDDDNANIPEVWMASIKKVKEMKNKENDKSVASTLPPPQPARLMKRKRFIDPQAGATRVSQIDDESHRLPAKRQQLEKGKEKQVILEEPEESRPAFETEDEDEDAEMYQVDSRKEDEERMRRSRKNLPDIGPSSSAAANAPTASAAPRTSTSSAKTAEQNGAKPRKIAPVKGPRDPKGSRASGGTEASRKLSAAGAQSDVDECDSEDEEYGEEEVEGGEEIEDDDESVTNDKRRAALNRRVERIVKKDLVKQAKPERLFKKRQPWGRKQTALLIRIIGERGCKWAEIRDMKVAEFSGRSNVQLKDKARNIKYDYLKARTQLPPNFEDVTISRTQVQTLQQMGINCDDYI